MKQPPNKDKLRDAIAHQVSAFLGEGGQIQQVRPGVTGVDPQSPGVQPFVFEQARQTRTPVTGAVAAIEARRRGRKKAAKRTATSRKPEKRIVYDDFGEPLRWVWRDD